MGLINTIICFLVIYYLYYTANQFYRLMNPMLDIEVTGPTIDPLWELNTSFSILCFLSPYSKFTSFKISDLKSNGIILFHKKGLNFTLNENKVEIDLNISSSKDHFNKGFTLPIIWNEIKTNSSSVYLHALVLRQEADSLDDITSTTINSGLGQYGVVKMIKHDVIPKNYHKRYLLSDFGYVEMDELDKERVKLPSDTIITYWKPEVAVRLVTDFTQYPHNYVPYAINPHIINPKLRQGLSESQKKVVTSQQIFYRPPIHVDEIGLTTDKYIPLNSSIHSLPLKISYEPMSLQRWLLMRHMEHSFQTNKGLGLTDNDLDDVRRLISDTSIYLLGVTIFASTLHLLFEFLAFQSDISFWQQNTSLTGLSVRSLVTDLISQIIIFLFLVDSNSSLLVTVPAFISILIQIWKTQKATGMKIKGFKIVFSRLNNNEIKNEKKNDSNKKENIDDTDKSQNEKDEKDEKDEKENNSNNQNEIENDELTRVTLEADRYATTHLGAILFPLIFGFAIYTLVMNKHLSWYSWSITTLTSCVYAGGFVLMCPQLFINHRLKSVAHLPWKFLCFKFVNTFIDDLFAFIIRMPVMHRLSVFRDDFVFIIYMYQRYIYRVDMSRPVEK